MKVEDAVPCSSSSMNANPNVKVKKKKKGLKANRGRHEGDGDVSPMSIALLVRFRPGRAKDFCAKMQLSSDI